MSNEWLNIMVLGWHLKWGRRFYPTISYNGYHKYSGWECGRVRLFTLFRFIKD